MTRKDRENEREVRSPLLLEGQTLTDTKTSLLEKVTPLNVPITFQCHHLWAARLWHMGLCSYLGYKGKYLMRAFLWEGIVGSLKGTQVIMWQVPSHGIHKAGLAFVPDSFLREPIFQKSVNP